MTKNLERHELIGLSIKIIESKNKSLVGLNGKIIDETQNTLSLQTANSIKKIIKNQITMKIKSNQKEIVIEGKDLVGRPHERIIKK